jgi:hypothetical protein
VQTNEDPPAAKDAAKLSQSFDSLGKGGQMDNLRGATFQSPRCRTRKSGELAG